MGFSIINSISQLMAIDKSKDVYVYGAKANGIRTCLYMENNGYNVKGFLVSNRYDNPYNLCNKIVYRIEDFKTKFIENVIISAGWQFVREIKNDLLNYDIRNIYTISPILVNKLEMDNSATQKCKISKESAIDGSVQIVLDNTSNVVIEDDCVIHGNVQIESLTESIIIIKKNTQINHDVLISARNGIIIIGENNNIERNTIIRLNQGELSIGDNSTIGIDSRYAIANGSINLGNKLNLCRNGIIDCDNGTIDIGSRTTINDNFYIGCSHSKIKIGEDNMYSFFIKMNTGSHEIVDMKTKKIINNTMPIVTGDHVWLGMGACLLPGCDVAEGSIVGAAALVNKSFPKNCICAGNPARIIRKNIKWYREKKIDIDKNC